MLAEYETRMGDDRQSAVAPVGIVPAGIVYASLDEPGIARRRAGKGFLYTGPNRARLTDAEILGRIRALAVPPAWRDVWICPRPDGHIQAVGYDANGRKQYRYHADFRAHREGAKFDHMLEFAEALPALRRQVDADMQARGLGREKVLATVVNLLETTMIRVGNKSYARDNGSYGLTTLRCRHVRIERGELRFNFAGKSGKVWRLGVRDRRVAKIVRACQELPGQHLFQYLDDDGQAQVISSADVNAYLKQVSGSEITAKDFRTWAGTVLAVAALARVGPAETKTAAKKTLRTVVQEVAARLGNTPTICRKCYIHPAIQEACLECVPGPDLGEWDGIETSGQGPGLRREEVAVLEFLRARMAPKTNGSRR
ncbi:MAG: DNA topoisomerase IB [Rhodospirillales bacterium]